MKGTKEMYDLMNQFERDIKNIPHSPSVRLDREKDFGTTYFYQDGTANMLFHSYLSGYSLGKSQTI